MGIQGITGFNNSASRAAGTVDFIARNKTGKDMIGQAIPSVSPGIAASYFQKTECFCFTEQVLKAGEEKIMPVIFIIDPSISEDVHEITLSYTFFIKPGSEDAKADRVNSIFCSARPLAHHKKIGNKNVIPQTMMNISYQNRANGQSSELLH